MSSKGYIRLHRQIQECWIWQGERFSKGQAWVDMLMMANHKDVKIPLGEHIEVVKRGQFITSIAKLADKWMWSFNTVKRFLNLLENDNMLTRKSDNRKTLITIINYDFYQYTEDEKIEGVDRVADGLTDGVMDSQMAEWLTDSLIPNNNDNNDNNEKNDNNNIPPISPHKEKPAYKYFEHPQLEKAFCDFAKMRNKIKKPLTEEATKRALTKLNKLSKGNVDVAIAILNQSVDYCWQGLYEPKEKPTESSSEKIEHHIWDDGEDTNAPYFGFPKEWFDGEKLVKERVKPVIKPIIPELGWIKEETAEIEELLDIYNLRRSYADGEGIKLYDYPQRPTNY